MNEFIVWDKNLKIFEIIETKSDIGFIGAYLNNPDRYCVFEHILNDTKGNKIYADCSIVEFDYDNLNGYYNKVKGFIYKDRWQYRLKVLWSEIGLGVDNLPMAYQKALDIKIIDTIQENKLGLIKE